MTKRNWRGGERRENRKESEEERTRRGKSRTEEIEEGNKEEI